MARRTERLYKGVFHPDFFFTWIVAVFLSVVFLGSLVIRPQPLPPPSLDRPLQPPIPPLGTKPAAVGHPGSSHHDVGEFWPVPKEQSSGKNQWKDHNVAALRHLDRCLSGLPACSEGRRHVVLLEAKMFRDLESLPGPEADFSGALLSALSMLDVTYIFLPTFAMASHYYTMFPSLIRAIITDKASLNKCWADDNCIKAPVNPLGPPIQDLHEVSLNGAPAHPFGPEWMLTGEGLGSKEELWYWLKRDWKKLAEDKLEKNPGLGNVNFSL